MVRICPQPIRQFLKLLVVLFFSTSIQAQFHTPFQIGSIGMSGSANPIYSGPVLISGADCFLLSNGIKTFDLSQTGYFSTACRLILMTEIENQLTAFPNPVLSTVTIKSPEPFKPINDLNIQLQLLDMEGRLMQTFQTNTNIPIGLHLYFLIPKNKYIKCTNTHLYQVQIHLLLKSLEKYSCAHYLTYLYTMFELLPYKLLDVKILMNIDHSLEYYQPY